MYNEAENKPEVLIFMYVVGLKTVQCSVLPFLLTVVTRYPSLKNIRELLYKHGHGSVNGRRTPLTSNADIEKVLGMFTEFYRFDFCG